jgi:transcriptional regulator with XRE-family HTH domain
MSDAREQSPIDAKRQLGEILERYRENEAGLSTEAVARQLGLGEATIRTWERGRSAPQLAALRALFELYKIPDDVRAGLERLLQEASKRAAKTPWGKVIPEQVRKLHRFEDAADRIRCFHSTLFYGPVQTRATAELVLASPQRSPEELEHLVDARMARLSFLRRPKAPQLVLVILESVLYQDHGAPDVLKEQLLHIVRLAQEHGVDVRIVPSVSRTRGYLPISVPFVLVTTSGQRTVVHLENLTDGIFVDDPDRVASYEAAFERLLGAAMSGDESIRLLSKVASEL